MYKVIQLPSDEYAFYNAIFININDKYDSEYMIFDFSNSNFIYKVIKLSNVADGCVAIQSLVRKNFGLRENDNIKLLNPLNIKKSYIVTCKLKITPKLKKDYGYDINYTLLTDHIKKTYNGQYFTQNQQILCSFSNINLFIEFTDIECLYSENNICNDIDYGMFDNDSKIILHSDNLVEFSNIPDNILDEQHDKPLFSMNPYDMENLGIGGLSNEFITLFRRAFISRLLPLSIQNKLNIKHTKGVLLYGPPGTGKTLIARKIGEMLNCKSPKIVNGPEILNKYVGESEKNIRMLFAEAEEEQKIKKEKSQLHLIIFDEFDSLCKKRGMNGDSTGIGDNIVNQLLSKIDGVDSLNNILLIGMTNRKDLIDEAILRQGRFEVHIQISLPDENGRYEILKIHTKKLYESNMIKNDVDLYKLASMAKNFSGAEIESLVKSSRNFALQRHIDKDNPTNLINIQDLIICDDDFMNAMKEIKPSFGNDNFDDSENENELIDYGSQWNDICKQITKYTSKFLQTQILSTYRLLLDGNQGVGKTTIANYISKIINYPYTKRITPSMFISYTETQKVNIIKKIFNDAYQSNNSVIIIDDLERIIDFSEYGNKYSNSILQTLLILINENTQKNKKLYIICTCKNISIIKSLELFDIFDETIHIDDVNSSGVEIVAKHYNTNFDDMNSYPIKRLIAKLLI
ncbi:Vesicular-fusion ATPase [Bodo saltans virus]|uniref:Vesicular-fusion ATPase n=1 Tax=Bodo saltans virus TaxID=2024608 RepID=A0A2H4UTU5_9VIRU|nr:Vesicular-fusion ATPase [Bodo saltans virus]ATZ80361.1 Vesicular-fusion ATPase [Bodo saltans virus]